MWACRKVYAVAEMGHLRAALIMAPLSNLFKSQDGFKRTRRPIVWSIVHQVAFERLKDTITSTPVLTQPDPMKPYTIEIDSSDIGNGMAVNLVSRRGRWKIASYRIWWS